MVENLCLDSRDWKSDCHKVQEPLKESNESIINIISTNKQKLEKNQNTKNCALYRNMYNIWHYALLKEKAKK